MKTLTLAPLLLLFPLLPGDAAFGGDGDADALLDAVVWCQTAAERDALCLQVYGGATRAVLATPPPAAGDKPLAVIVDVDETALDNSPYMARLILDQQSFAADSWSKWCHEAKAPPIPGAVAFATACHARGVTVFYVTNRDQDFEAATRQNLAAAGFPLDDADGVDVALLRGEVDGKASKVGRRARVAERFTVVALVGDDLNDFTDAETSVAARQAVILQHAADWGAKWFLLPNPMYGSWERAAIAGNRDAFAGKRAALRPLR